MQAGGERAEVALGCIAACAVRSGLVAVRIPPFRYQKCIRNAYETPSPCQFLPAGACFLLEILSVFWRAREDSNLRPAD